MRVPFYAAKNGSWARCTPACDGETLFVGGMRDVLVALDVTNGKERWRVDYPTDEKNNAPPIRFRLFANARQGIHLRSSRRRFAQNP